MSRNVVALCRPTNSWNILSSVRIKDINVMTEGRSFFEQPVKMMKGHKITLERLHMVK